MIERYSFGQIVIDGHEYRSDIIIYPDGRIDGSWWRRSGHVLMWSDIEELIRAQPSIIICGMGVSSLMKPERQLKAALAGEGIEFKAAASEAAVNLYNELQARGDVGACFHLSC